MLTGMFKLSLAAEQSAPDEVIFGVRFVDGVEKNELQAITRAAA